jgi:hypothetical protein
MGRKPDERFDEQEAQQRFEAALRGARTVGHKQLKDISPRRPKTRRSSKPERDSNERT